MLTAVHTSQYLTRLNVFADIGIKLKYLCLFKSPLALSNRLNSKFCELNALVTSIPSIFSRLTKLSLSTSFCISVILGIATRNINTIKITIADSETMIIHESSLLFSRALTAPPTPKIGA